MCVRVGVITRSCDGVIARFSYCGVIMRPCRGVEILLLWIAFSRWCCDARLMCLYVVGNKLHVGVKGVVVTKRFNVEG